MADDTNLAAVSFTDAFLYGLRMVFSSIVFIVLLLIIQAVGVYLMYLGFPHCCVDPMEDKVDNNGNGLIDESTGYNEEINMTVEGEETIEVSLWENNGQLTDLSYGKIIGGFIIYIVAAIGFFAILVAIWYKMWVDIISRSDFHFTKRDSF